MEESQLDDQYYYELDGKLVTKAQKHREKGKCCKCHCLHCPYGFTVQKLGFSFSQIPLSEISKAQKIIDGASFQGGSIFDQMVLQATGKSEKQHIEESNKEDFSYIYLKSYLCGVLYKKSKIYLTEHFKDQGIKLDDVLISLK